MGGIHYPSQRQSFAVCGCIRVEDAIRNPDERLQDRRKFVRAYVQDAGHEAYLRVTSFIEGIHGSRFLRTVNQLQPSDRDNTFNSTHPTVEKL